MLLTQLAQAELPPDGLRGCLKLGGTLWLALILPSRDKPGRCFPLALVTPFAFESYKQADQWCEEAVEDLQAATSGALDADALWRALSSAATQGDVKDDVPQALWTSASPPTPLEQALSDLNSA